MDEFEDGFGQCKGAVLDIIEESISKIPSPYAKDLDTDERIIASTEERVLNDLKNKIKKLTI